MPQLEIGIDPALPGDLAGDLHRHLEVRWPELSLTPLRLPAPRRDARDGPLLLVLQPGTALPPGDPGERAVVCWDGSADAGGRGPLFRQVDLEIARVTAPRRGRPPAREVSPPPREMTRRALLQIPLPLGRPLPDVPWVEGDLCLQGQGCDQCAAACPQDAIGFAGAAATVDAGRCTGCGACVAACPTGALESAYLGDGQWRAALEVLESASGAERLLLQCREVPPQTPAGDLALRVGCIAEVGWHRLVTCLAATGRLPDIACPRGDCPLQAEAQAALARLALLRAASAGPAAALPPAAAPDVPKAPRRAEFSAAMRRLEGAMAEAAEEAPWPQLGWAPRISGSCTLCSGCVHACPTQALRIEEQAEWQALRIDPGLCTGCGACARICPEQVLTISAALPAELTGPRDACTEQRALCKGCGVPYETQAFVAAMRQRMAAAGFSGVLVERLDYCPECRAAVPSHQAQERG